MTTISLNNRRAAEQYASKEIEVVLALIRHPLLSYVVRLSSDPTERLTAELLEYGTRSTWQTAAPATDPFKFVMMAADLPDETDAGGGQATLILDIANTDIGAILTSTTKRGTVDLAIVLASSPNIVEWEARDLKIIGATGDGDTVQFTFEKEDILSEMNPAPRMTKQRMPGMHP